MKTSAATMKASSVVSVILLLLFLFLCASLVLSLRYWSYAAYEKCTTSAVAQPLSGKELMSSEEFTEKYLSLRDRVKTLKKGKQLTDSNFYYQFPEENPITVQRKNILFAVMTTEKYLLTRARTIYNTWAQDVGPKNQFVFFVGEHSNTSHPALKGLPIIKIAGIRDDLYPPLEKVFGILEYFYKEFGERFRWFVRADDDVYIRVDKLEAMLRKQDWTQRLYMGQRGRGMKIHQHILKLLPTESYCMGGSSILFSAAGLKALYPHLGKCLKATFMYNSRVSKDMRWVHDDVEVGRCASRTLGLHCTSGSQVHSWVLWLDMRLLVLLCMT